MAKKRDRIKRRRDVTKTRTRRKRDARSGPKRTPSPQTAKSQSMDLWLAVGIVVVIVAAFVALYYFTVRKPTGKKAALPAIEETAQSPAESATPSASPTKEVKSEPQSEHAMSWPKPPAMTIDPTKSYQAVIKTEKGDIRLELFAAKAPMAVNNLVFLARQGYYDGVTFHRVLSGFMAQTGDPTGTGAGGPGYRVRDEFDPTLRHDTEGTVSMANSGPGTNGSQFFITYAPQPHLDGHHAVFGRVIEGMDVLRSLTPRDPGENPNAPPGDKIVTIEIIES